MDDRKTFFAQDRREWRDWLCRNFETENEIWFVFPSADAGEKGVSYNDAVEEALCFGWIDGRAGTLDDTHQLRRFTPRRKGSAAKNDKAVAARSAKNADQRSTKIEAAASVFRIPILEIAKKR